MRRHKPRLIALDRVDTPNLWPEIDRRSASAYGDPGLDEDRRPARGLGRLGVVVTSIATFSLAATLTWIVFSPVGSSPNGTGANDVSTNPPIVPIADGFRVYSGEWQEIAWELVVLPASAELTCGPSTQALAYRDAHSTDWQGCPDPHFSVEVFPAGESNGALMVGSASPEVAAIQVNTKDGRVVDGVILPLTTELGLPYNAFVIQVPGSWPGALVAKSTQGAVLQRRSLDLPSPVSVKE